MSDLSPINKGNYSSMEPPEREELFSQYRGEGWEEEYRQYRRNWSEWPENQHIAEYPLEVDLELSNICNLNCPMCFRRNENYKHHSNLTFMDFNLFTRIIDEISGKVPALRLSLRGESTLHPQFLECISYAKEHGIQEVSFLTNGSTLEGKFFEKIVQRGADWITVSIDGLYETYEQIRKPLKFNETFQKIKEIHKIKKQYGVHRPVIKIQTVWPAIAETYEEYYNLFAPHVDLIAFNPLIDYLKHDTTDSIEFIDNFYCPQHYQRLIIGADGIAMMCTNDEENTQDIGDANTDTIHAIWHGEKLNSIRSLHRQQNGFKKISVCRQCFLPRRTEPTGTYVVNGRHFVVQNYINRSQTIGQ